MSLWSKNTAVSHLKAEQSGWTWCSVCLLIISSGALSSPRPHGTQVPMIFGRNSEQNASKQVVFQFPWRRVWWVVPPPVSMTWEPTPGRWQPRCNQRLQSMAILWQPIYQAIIILWQPKVFAHEFWQSGCRTSEVNLGINWQSSQLSKVLGRQEFCKFHLPPPKS